MVLTFGLQTAERVEAGTQDLVHTHLQQNTAVSEGYLTLQLRTQG